MNGITVVITVPREKETLSVTREVPMENIGKSIAEMCADLRKHGYAGEVKINVFGTISQTSMRIL